MISKKHVCILALVLAVVTTGMSHASETPSVGLKLGVSSANISNVEVDGLWDDPSSTFGLTFGGFVSMSIGNNLYLQPEILFTQKGAEWKGSYFYDFAVEDIKLVFRLNYLEIPVLVKYVFSGGSLRPYIYAGPYAGFKLSSKYRIEVAEESVEEDVDAELKGVDFGLAAGAGLALEMGSGELSVELRYTLGLSAIEKGTESKNKVLSLMLGYGF